MFFSISKLTQDNFPCQWYMAGLVINTDQGWHCDIVDGIKYVYKGYADASILSDILPQIFQQTEPKFTGNFCVFVDQQDRILIRTSQYRSFPLWYSSQTVTNLVPTDKTIWSDSQCEVLQDLSIAQQTFVPFEVDVKYTAASALDQIDNILTKKTRQLAQQLDRPIKIFLSGGIDTMLIYSYILREKVPHELVRGLYIDYDDFYLANSGSISRNWSYNQIHHWKQPCMLASGTPGDEYMLRSPTTANVFLRWHGTSINEQLLKRPGCMHEEYFRFSKHQVLFDQQNKENLQFATKNDLYFFLLNWLHNDWQHHHLGNTLTWTPLRDLELLQIMLSMDLDDQIDQIMDSKISRSLIERNIPGLSQHLSTQKNHENFMYNLRNLYKSTS